MEYRLKEIFDLKMGKTPSRNNPEYWNSKDNKWISISDLSKCGKLICDTKEYISDKAVMESGISVIPENTVIMSFKLSIGRTAITSEPMYSNEAIMSFRDKKVVNLLPDYVYYMLLGRDWNEGTNKAVMGKTLNKATLSEIKINVHSLAKQQEIVSTLDKLQSIITHLRTQLEKLDLLVKDRFVEMFGDCKNRMSMADLCSIITDGTHQSPKFQLTGIPFILVSNLSENKITYNTEKYISYETYKELYKRTPIEKGDILLSTVGSYGHPAVVFEDRKFLFQRHIAYLKPKHELINSIYLHSAILSPDIQKQIEERVKGIAQKTLNLSEIRKIAVPVPNIALQTQFADFVKQVDKSIFVVQKELDKAQMLFGSLMQEYFG